MKKRKKVTAKKEPRFPQVPSRAWNIRRQIGSYGENSEALHALLRAVNEARELGFASLFDSLEKVLFLAEPWIDRDILRSHILKDGDPADGTKFGIAFVRGDGKLIESIRWYILPPATTGEIPVQIVAIALSLEDHRVLVKDGYNAFFSKVLSGLEGR